MMNTNQSGGNEAMLCRRKGYIVFSLSAWWAIVFGLFFIWFFLSGEETPNHFVRVVLPVILGCLGFMGSFAGLHSLLRRQRRAGPGAIHFTCWMSQPWDSIHPMLKG